MDSLAFEVGMPNIFILIFALIMAVYLMFLSLKTLIGHRPLVAPSRWLFAFVCLAFLPIIASNIAMAVVLYTGFTMNTRMIPIPVIYSVILVFLLWIQWRQLYQRNVYEVFAISDTYFREALLSAAGSLGFSIEETMSRLKIKESGQEMQVAINGWVGTAHLKSTGKESDEAVSQIAAAMAKYFQSTPGNMNYIVSYFYLIMGVSLTVPIAMFIGTFT